MTTTTNDVARKTIVAVSVAGVDFTEVKGKVKVTPVIAEASTEDGATMEDGGWARPEVTQYSWSLDLEVMRQRSADDAEDPLVHDAGQELCRAAAGNSGVASELYVQWYDSDGILPAYQGLALVTWKDKELDIKGLKGATITFTGKGELAMDVDNPNAPEEG